MITTSAFLLSACLSLIGTQDPVDPEAEPGGRVDFLGREVARTMHWMGAGWLLRETREKEENGLALREYLDARSPQVVCDLGCGNGYHTLPLAEAVLPEGRVLAVDLQPEMLEFLAARAEELGVQNVERIVATVDDPKLPPDEVDLCLLVDVYHELSHPVSVMGRVRRSLREGGRLVLVEFRSEDPRVPIKPLHKMSKAQVINELAVLGFRCVDEFDELPWQHVLSFECASADPMSDAAMGEHAAHEVGLGAWRARTGEDPRILAGFLVPEGLQLLDGRGGADAPEPATLSKAPADRSGAAHFVAGEARSWLHVDAGDGHRESLRLLADPEVPGSWRVDGWARARGLVAMNTATGRGTPLEQVALAADLGYSGIGWGIWRTDEVRAACDERGLRLESVYVVLDVTAEPGPKEAQLANAISSLSPGGAVWLALESGAHETSDPAGDGAARATIERVAAMAEKVDARISLYPHHSSWLETFEDALRIAEAVDRPDVGVNFNLCHWIRNHPGAPDPAPLLERAGDRLFAVTVNGADREGVEWSSLIQPLDRGTYEVGPLLQSLEAMGYEGPFGLQGFGLKEPPREHLTRSIAAWWRMAPSR